MGSLFNSEKKKKPAKKKGDSARETLTLFENGKSIEEIAEERNLTESTIAGHLARFAIEGTLDFHRFVSKEQYEKALEILENRDENVSIYSTLSQYFSKIETTFISAWLRENSDKK